ncbi:hypothetical protein [Sphingobacterium sp. 1.A.4]|uniref:hypothetical protein n=1 Tax=Sphingobacterium sp. 1.A.4 TaxID=2044603 RepID=UPI000C0C048F|nr:hypothetical protein [Sphingobacterium sp. 1.A.4]
MKTRDELIQDYIDGVLRAEDRLEFDRLLREDVDFGKELNLQKEMHGILKDRLGSKEEELRTTLKAVEREIRDGERDAKADDGEISPENIKVVSWKKWIIPLVAAACLLLIGKFFFFPSSYNYELPDMPSEIVRGQEDPELNRYEEAVKAYNSKDYEKSTLILEELSAKEPELLQYRYFLGLSLMGKKDFLMAVDQLTPIADGESVFQQDACYYLGVSLHELERDSEAVEYLEKVSRESKHYEDAQELLEIISKYH